ncbi:MAG: aminopeptidase [Pseudomonadales bacterium]|nr:aminopeptidase [Pseudomonadales bacterium]
MMRLPLRLLTVFTFALALSACDLPYYWQAAQGQLSLVNQRQSIDEIIAAPSTPDSLKAKLRYLLRAREFALQQLDMPENKSYLTYVDLGRDHVVWNVFATHELSMANQTWCYPIAGCVSYRGYFSENDAKRFANDLAQQGYDTYVGGVGAYSTLGWFEDSVLNTFISRSDTALAALLFHELAHQTLYVKNDTQFNESYASAVEQILLQQWLMQSPDQWQAYLTGKARHDAFSKMVIQNKHQRETLFESNLPDEQKRAQKSRLQRSLMEEYQQFKHDWQFDGYDNWFAKGLNNAQLSTVATYNELLPGFLALYGKSEQNLHNFIQASVALSQKDKTERHQQLKQLASKNIVYTEK